MSLPRVLAKAILNGVWRDPGPNEFNKIIGENYNLPELQLFESYELMCSIHEQIRSGGYVDDSEFCMVEKPDLKAKDSDPRLNFGRALFIAGSVVPGDDVFLVVDLDSDENDPSVLILDWYRPVPERWVEVMKLTKLINMLKGDQLK